VCIRNNGVILSHISKPGDMMKTVFFSNVLKKGKCYIVHWDPTRPTWTKEKEKKIAVSLLLYPSLSTVVNWTNLNKIKKKNSKLTLPPLSLSLFSSPESLFSPEILSLFLSRKSLSWRISLLSSLLSPEVSLLAGSISGDQLSLAGTLSVLIYDFNRNCFLAWIFLD
jgi:hypothetical protein